VAAGAAPAAQQQRAAMLRSRVAHGRLLALAPGSSPRGRKAQQVACQGSSAADDAIGGGPLAEVLGGELPSWLAVVLQQQQQQPSSAAATAPSSSRKISNSSCETTAADLLPLQPAVLVNSWRAYSAVKRLPESLGDFRSWTDDGLVDSMCSCAVFTQMWLSKADAEWRAQTAVTGVGTRPQGGVGGRPTASTQGVGIFRADAAGPIPFVHGGAIATALDTILGQTTFLNGTLGVTASLKVSFRGSIPLRPHGTAVLFRARVDRVRGRKVDASAELLAGDTRKILATATALFVMAPQRLAVSSAAQQSELRRKTLAQSALPRLVQIGSSPPSSSVHHPRTATAAAMLAGAAARPLAPPYVCVLQVCGELC
jgi:acyl-coenzyme A thioesterase PaaI-like protein